MHHPQFLVITELPIIPPLGLFILIHFFWILLIPYDTQGVACIQILYHQNPGLTHNFRVLVIYADFDGE